MWALSVGQEDPLDKEMATHSSILTWKILWRRSLAGYSLQGRKRVRHNVSTNQQQQRIPLYALGNI